MCSFKRHSRKNSQTQVPKPIPKWLFQTIAVITILVCLSLTTFWIITDTGLYHYLNETFIVNLRAIAMLATFLILFAGWLIIIIPLRKLTEMPTIIDQLETELPDGLSSLKTNTKSIYDKENEVVENLYQTNRPSNILRKKARQIGGSLLLVGLIISFVGVWMLALIEETGTFQTLQIMVILLGPVLFIIGLIQLITGKSIIRKKVM